MRLGQLHEASSGHGARNPASQHDHVVIEAIERQCC